MLKMHNDCPYEITWTQGLIWTHPCVVLVSCTGLAAKLWGGVCAGPGRCLIAHPTGRGTRCEGAPTCPASIHCKRDFQYTIWCQKSQTGRFSHNLLSDITKSDINKQGTVWYKLVTFSIFRLFIHNLRWYMILSNKCHACYPEFWQCTTSCIKIVGRDSFHHMLSPV